MTPISDAEDAAARPALLARIAQLTALLRECRDHISDERDILLDSFTLRGDRSTMLAGDAEEVVEFDDLLERLDDALGDAVCGCTDAQAPDPNPPFHGFAKARTP